MKLRNYQEVIREFILENKRCNVFVPMGLGKTAATLKALEALSVVEKVKVLVIAPLRVAQSTWPQEVKKWGLDFKVSVINGNPEQRIAILGQNSDIFTVDYTHIPWLVDHFKYRRIQWPFNVLVVDEVSKLKGFRLRQGTKRAKSLATVAHKSVDRWIGLTGTPAPNGLKNLWGPMWFIDKGNRLGRSYTEFSNRWFRKAYHGFDIFPLENSQKEIQDRIRDVCLSLDSKEYFAIDEPLVNKVIVDMPPKAARYYKSMEKKMFSELEGKLGPTSVEARNASAKTQKCLQLANGAVYTDDKKNWSETHDEKIKALDDIIEEAAGAPVLVAYHFRNDLDRLKSAFPSGRVLDSDPTTIVQWNKGEIPILFAHPASAGHGLNLQDGGNILVFFSVNWNLEEHEQIIERIGPTRQKQAGYDRPVFVHYILTRDTIDFDVLDRLQTKATIQDILAKAMKRNS